MKILNALNGLFTRGFSYDTPTLNQNCSEFEVNNWIISKFVINELVPIVDIHPFPINEQMLMVSAVCRLRPSHIFEWGTNIGKSTRIFYVTSKTFGIHVEIHSIDLPDDIEHVEHPKSNRGMLVKEIKEVNLHLGDGLNTSLRLLSEAKTVTAPLFFVDGDHSYESVKRELEGITVNVPQANILLHDTFYQSTNSGYNIGPHKAVTDVLTNLPNKYKIISQTLGLPGMTLLWQEKLNKQQ
jgi:cephalosporin hydroxylase